MTTPNVVVTDYAIVKIGPKFGLMLDALAPSLAKSKRTKAHKFAKGRLERVETAVFVLAEAEFRAGGVLEQTP